MKEALVTAKALTKTTVIYVETDLYQGVDGYSWWEVPIAEVSEVDTVKEAYQDYKEKRKKQRNYM